MIKQIIYYLIDKTFPGFENQIIDLVKNKKNVIIFDVGCFKGFFFKKFFKSKILKENKLKFYLFDINPNVRDYLKEYINKKNIFFEYRGIGKSNQTKKYYLNKSFESSGSSMSNLYKDDKLWVSSRKIFLKLFFQKTPSYQLLKVPVIRLDDYIKKRKVKKIDILKIDVDGSEEDVLAGMHSILKKNIVSILQIEITGLKSTYKKKENKIYSLLKKNNFILKRKKYFLSVSVLSKLRCTDNLFVHKNLNQ